MADEDIGLTTIRNVLGEGAGRGMTGAAPARVFAGGRGGLALKFTFGEIWSRPGLDIKYKLMVTLGAMIALRQTEEIKNYVIASIRHGFTVEEVEEAFYQALPYAGFPAVHSAAIAAGEALAAAGLME